MKFMIDLRSGHRSIQGTRLPKLWHPGRYRIPEDMPAEIADDCLKAGTAKQVAYFPRPAAPVSTAPRKRGRPRKHPAPENKLQPTPAENKEPEAEADVGPTED